MFAKVAQFVTLASLALAAVASPVPQAKSQGLAARGGHSFNSWGGFSSLANFDNFYGVDDFSHVHFDQTIVHEHELVCHSQEIEIIQQRLVVLQEMAKRIITEQICEVETQTVVFSQFHASLGVFSDDLRRHSGHQVGFDEGIVNHFGEIVASDGSLTTNDFGFVGTDVGKNTIVVDGSNWVDSTSPNSVDQAFFASQGARFGF